MSMLWRAQAAKKSPPSTRCDPAPSRINTVLWALFSPYLTMCGTMIDSTRSAIVLSVVLPFSDTQASMPSLGRSFNSKPNRRVLESMVKAEPMKDLDNLFTSLVRKPARGRSGKTNKKNGECQSDTLSCQWSPLLLERFVDNKLLRGSIYHRVNGEYTSYITRSNSFERKYEMIGIWP